MAYLSWGIFTEHRHHVQKLLEHHLALPLGEDGAEAPGEGVDPELILPGDQYSTVQYSTEQYSTAKYSTVARPAWSPPRRWGRRT